MKASHLVHLLTTGLASALRSRRKRIQTRLIAKLVIESIVGPERVGNGIANCGTHNQRRNHLRCRYRETNKKGSEWISLSKNVADAMKLIKPL